MYSMDPTSLLPLVVGGILVTCNASQSSAFQPEVIASVVVEQEEGNQSERRTGTLMGVVVET